VFSGPLDLQFTNFDPLFHNYRQSFIDAGVRARDDVHADKFADAARGGGTGVGRGLDGGDVPTDNGRDKSGTDLLIPDKLHVRSFHHCIGRFDHRDEALALYHSQCFLHLVVAPGFDIEIRKM
jgi:hypothetical protein